MADRDDTTRRPFDALPIARSLRCVDCGYDLRGLRIGGACPECGAPVWHTVLARIDPEGSRLPRLHNPRAVGLGMVLVSSSLMVMPCGPLSAPLVGLVVRLLGAPANPAAVADRISLLGALAALPGLLGVVALVPARTSRIELHVARGLRAMALGFVAWLVTGVSIAAHGASRTRWAIGDAGADQVLMIVGLLAMGTLFLGYGRILRHVGLRSREFRTATTNRQRMAEMALAAFALAASETVFLVATRIGLGPVAFGATVLSAVTWAMLVIGLVYLLLNTAWIAGALLRPPPTIAELLSPEPGRSDDDGPGEAEGGGGLPTA